MKCSIVIPARYESSRFPGKPLVNILGKSLIQRVWENCCGVMGPEDVYVATDNDEIKDHCEALGIQVIMTSPECLTGTDRICEAAANLDSEVVINVQGDEPLLPSEDIRKVLVACLSDPGNVYCGMCPIQDEEDFRRTSIPKVVAREDGRMLYMSRAGVPTTKDLAFRTGMKQVCVYAFPRDALQAFGDCDKKGKLEQLEDIELLRYVDLGWEVVMVELSQTALAVDYPEDVARVEEVLRKNDE